MASELRPTNLDQLECDALDSEGQGFHRIICSLFSSQREVIKGQSVYEVLLARTSTVAVEDVLYQVYEVCSLGVTAIVGRTWWTWAQNVSSSILSLTIDVKSSYGSYCCVSLA